MFACKEVSYNLGKIPRRYLARSKVKIGQLGRGELAKGNFVIDQNSRIELKFDIVGKYNSLSQSCFENTIPIC